MRVFTTRFIGTSKQQIIGILLIIERLSSFRCKNVLYIGVLESVLYTKVMQQPIDSLSIMNKMIHPNVSIIWRFHCNELHAK